VTQLKNESYLVELLKEKEISRKENDKHLRETIQRLEIEKDQER